MSNTGSSCTIIRPLLAGYVLDMLTPAETVLVIQHLGDCPACVAEVIDQRELLGKMPQLWAELSGVEAPPALKENIVAQITSDARVRPPKEISVKPVQIRPVPIRRNSWQLAFWAAILLLVGVLAWGLDTNRQLGDEREAHQLLVSQLAGQQGVLNIVDGHETSIQILLPAEMSENRPYGKFYVNPERRDVVIAGWDLPTLPPDYVYYAWLRSENELILAGTMAVDLEGFGWVYFEGDQLPQAYEGVGFTMQPIGETESNRQGIIAWQADP